MKPTTRVFELTWPDSGLPAFVGFGTKLWWPRWELRAIDGSKLGAYFRTLEARGLTPQVSDRWLPSHPMPRPAAIAIAASRLRQIADWAGCWPEWICNYPDHRIVAVRPVARLAPDGSLDHYGSIYAAAAARGVHNRAIAIAVRTGRHDHDGGRWIEPLRTCLADRPNS
ncbi:hypothetical protein [Anatilimnocola floriformis]|uniref:hypothetical protein n=1 Tax=Anatilimnocola floriformis TaxID=2948575 RepID=UPI0020C32976|nr:hypothetical protein [Anatilimnocola floriformis]